MTASEPGRGRRAPEDYVGRFAPSPTGFMHFGVARTALAAWLDARAHRGKILLRIEDLDTPRVVPGAAAALREDLAWLGLDFDDEPVVQSERLPRYAAALARLAAEGRAFGCACSRRDVEAAASAPHVGDEGPRYPGTCRDRGLPLDRGSVRLRTEPDDRVNFVDRLAGAVDEAVHVASGDFVIRRRDGLFAYQLAVTVDDLAQGVTHVVRGNDLLGSTGRQILLRRILDPAAPVPSFLHVPLVRGPDGARLAKRHGARAIRDRRLAGEPAERVIGELAASLGLHPAGEPVSAVELVTMWTLERLRPDDATLVEPRRLG